MSTQRYFRTIHLSKKIRNFDPKGIILSGGPSSVYGKGAPIPDLKIFDLGVPILGICYGMQLMAHMLGGKVAKAAKREYGRAELIIDDNSDLFVAYPHPPLTKGGAGVNSHYSLDEPRRQDRKIPGRLHAYSPYRKLSRSGNGKQEEAILCAPVPSRGSSYRKRQRDNKEFRFQDMRKQAGMDDEVFYRNCQKEIREKVGNRRVVCGISGGVDSAVTAGPCS